MTTTKKRAKFGHLRVGDEVGVIGDNGYEYIAKVWHIDMKHGRLQMDDDRKFTMATGRAGEDDWHAGANLVELTPEFRQRLKDRDERDELTGFFHGKDWSKLPLAQLRQIKAWLDAAQQAREGE